MFDLYLSIGGNLGDRNKNLADCRKKISNEIGVIVKSSSIYQSESWGFTHPRDFYNQVLYVKTKLNANAVLSKIKNIESALGRIRNKDKAQAYEGRTIDIDILLYNQLVLKDEHLTIPHPHMQNRNFVMIPLAEIAESVIHPVLHQSMREIRLNCLDKSKITRISPEKLKADE